ncbi:helix-turn-helix domain-containing protein [Bifidobacterium ruminantium]|uniref:helix-turn-helix domain-containing protein n=1 Tax=Bifidobacterium ruminantium TaxID=78346 RepID=UPI00249061C6|nr:helix-turn-helix transcriptional regulator [Bifidobacterium ruminantium]
MVTLQQLRLNKGYTLAELAELSGLSLGRIGNWEAWSRDPRPKTARDPLLMSMQSAIRLSSALGVTLDTLAQCLADSSTSGNTGTAENGK